MNTVTITLPPCRSDTATFFSDSGYYSKSSRWSHCPVLAFAATDGQVEVQILASPTQVKQSQLPDSTPCMQQWRGQWSSDFFAFTLGEARAALR
jgi:hypothetical protein